MFVVDFRERNSDKRKHFAILRTEAEMKVFMANGLACVYSYEPELTWLALRDKVELVEECSEADVIIFTATCANMSSRIHTFLENATAILEKKRPDAKVVLTGCLARGWQDRLGAWDSPLLIYMSRWINIHVDLVLPTRDLHRWLYGDPNYEIGIGSAIGGEQEGLKLHLGTGCMNRCTFCKSTFQNFALESAPLSDVRWMVKQATPECLHAVHLMAPNLCQCGLDHDSRPYLPSLLYELEQNPDVRLINLYGFAFRDAIRWGFDKTLSDCHKIGLIKGSLESGSNHILDKMKKGYRVEQVVEFVRSIRDQVHTGFQLSIIAGFPGETLVDIAATLRALTEFPLYRVQLYLYNDSPFIESHKLVDQLSLAQIQAHAEIYMKELDRRHIPYDIVDE